MKRKTTIDSFGNSLSSDPIAFRPGGGYDSADDLPTEYSGGQGGGGYADGGITDVPSSSGENDVTDINDSTIFGDLMKTEVEVAEIGLLGLFWSLEGKRVGHIYRIHDNDLIGRKSAELILDDNKVSSPHARIRIENDHFVLWDCGSKNGTLVNGTRIRCAVNLKENDRIKIGESLFVIKILN